MEDFTKKIAAYGQSDGKEETDRMAQYRVSVMRLGRALVEAESKEAAGVKAQELPENEIHWLSKKDGLEGNYVVISTELNERGE